MTKTAADILSLVADEGYEFIDLRFCDLPGQVQHFTVPVKQLTEDGGYQLVAAPGPDVLHIEAYIIDLVIKVPTQVTAGRRQGAGAVSSYASVTAVLELYDSESQEILARVADRGDPTLSASYASVEPAFVKADLTRLFEYWAGLLRQGLDQVRELGLP